LLWVFAWGRSFTLWSAASFAIRARLRSTISSSTTATGVMMSSVAARMRSTSINSAPGEKSQAAVDGEAIKDVSIPAFDGVRRDERVEGRFLGRLGDGVEDLVDG